MRRRFDGHRRIAPGQRQQLVLVEVEAIRFFKRRQRVRALNKFRRSRQLKFAALLQVATEVGQRGQLIFSARSWRTAIVQVLLAGAGVSHTS